MKTSRLLTLLLLALPLPVACSSDGAGGGSGSGPISRADAPAVFAQAICGNVEHCCDDAGLVFDQAACTRMFTGELTSEWNRPDTGFDPNAAGRCLEQTKQLLATCSRPPGNRCEGMIFGTLPNGAPCEQAQTCEDPADGLADCEEGFCVQHPRGKAGDGCAGTCPEDTSYTYCTPVEAGEGPAHCYRTDGLYCADSGNCEALLPAGEPCNEVACAAGNYCDGVCTPIQAAGGECSRTEGCVETAYCDLITNVCVAKKPMGASCVEYDECLEGYCNSGKCPFGPATTETCSGE